MNRIKFDNIRDMNLEHVFECGQCFRWNKLDDGRYLGVVHNLGCIAKLDEKKGELDLIVSGGDEAFWYSYFDLGMDYGKIKDELCKKEPNIEDATKAGYGIRILKQDFYEVLISFIVSQNNNIPRIKKCIEAICENYGDVIELEGHKLYSFPSAEVLSSLSEDDLARLKLGYRSAYIIRAAKKYLEEGVPSEPDSVLDYYGVGPKVANCIKLFGLRQLDAFPIDTWVKKIMNDMYGFDEKDVRGMQQFAEEHFGEMGGIAQQYLFDFYRNHKG